MFEDAAFSGMDAGRTRRESDKGHTASESIPPPPTSGALQTPSAAPSASGTASSAFPFQPANTSQPSQPPASTNTAQLNHPQQRTMVMPDRMRWVYTDPQGNTQGPWSGLEMHDWYKAGFFTQDLLVRKLEDSEYETLGQVIRRIGNSREPFLVPQIGVAHGPPSNPANGPFTASGPGGSQPGPSSGTVQPPFAGAFPSFGTTLTAEQQNNLERRKQEEQYLMARQREFLAQQQAQQQANLKQMQMAGALPSQLHHHSSAHSLHSQPSYGSITSPIGGPPQGQMVGPGMPAFFDGPMRQPVGPGLGQMGPGPDFLREEEMRANIARMSLHDSQRMDGSQLQVSQQQFEAQLPGNIAALMAQRNDMKEEFARVEALRGLQPGNAHERLREFEMLRAEHEAAEQASQAPITRPAQKAESDQSEQLHQLQSSSQFDESITEPPVASTGKEKGLVTAPEEPEVLSLTQQVQKAASAKQTPNPATQVDSPWAKVNPNLPMPFPPPPQSASPLPAPTAQRTRSHLPEALNVESRSHTQTPSADTPSGPASVAPWAKETTEGPKGPSLKEIQEAEAKKAAKAEEIAAAARRAALQQELMNQPAAPAPGLPSSSTWGSGNSPVTSSNAPSAWTKPIVGKVPAPAAGVNSKKTLAQIQKEEELRKQKLAAAASALASASGVGSAGVAAGKRYADLASKASSAQPNPTAGGAWTTVGASGKVKTPATTSAGAPPGLRSTSNSSVPGIGATRSTKPAATSVRTNTIGAISAQSSITNANDEFMKWAKNALAKGLNSNINGKH
jgi:PERQ amino acid-rich with GYF domain-containing protein